MRPSAQPFLWKWVLLLWKWKIISISKAEHLTSFWYRGPGSSEMAFCRQSSPDSSPVLSRRVRLRLRDFLILLYQVVHAREPASLGTLRNYDGDGNVKKAIGSFSIDDSNGSENVIFKMNSRFFSLCRVYSNLLKMASVGKFPWSWFLEDRTQV